MDTSIKISVGDLVSGMVVSQDVRDKRGRLLLKTNQRITPSMLKRIQRFKISSVSIYLGEASSLPMPKFREIAAVSEEYAILENSFATQNKVTLAGKDDLNIYNTFFLQIGNLISSGAREILRSDVNVGEAKRIILRAICDKEILNLLMELRVKDRYLLNHSVEVTVLCAVIALESEMDELRIRNLITAAILHDIGMTQISDHILFKTKSLTLEEKDIIQTHAAKSVMLLVDIPKIDREVLDIIFQHHERFNGTGYPKGLTENIINQSAKILSICDVCSAISHTRSYRGKLSPQEKIEFFFGSGNHIFSYDIVTMLLDKICIYHKGQWVKLNTGQVGIISGVDEKFPTRPYVKLVYDQFGGFMLRPKEIFLGERANATIFIEQII